MPEDREEKPLLLRERITFVAAAMHSIIAFVQTGFEEAKANPSENDFMMMDEDLGGDLRVKAMEACMSVIAAIADQHEEDTVTRFGTERRSNNDCDEQQDDGV